MQSFNDYCKDIKDTDPIQPSVKYIGSEVKQMRWALIAITKEIQRFNNTESIESKNLEEFEVLSKILKYKLRIKKKKKQIKRLNENIKTCYILVKLLISKVLMSKEKHSWNLTKTFLIETSKHIDFIKNQFIKVELMKQLSKKNDFYEKKLKDIQNYIYHVYNELPNKSIQKSFNSDEQLLENIKTIIFHYEQQSIYFSTERAKCQLTEQKNSFLKNKINILECNIESLKEEHVSLAYQLSKRNREITFYKNKLFNNINDKKMLAVESPHKITNPNNSSCVQHKNLSSHLALVNTLLIDQDTMINNLKYFSNHIYTIV